MSEMKDVGVSIVDTVQAHLLGAPVKLVVLGDDGRFFIGKREGDQVKEVTPPAAILQAAQLARAVVAGDPRAMTGPGNMLVIATALLCALYRVASMAEFIEAAVAAAEKSPDSLVETLGASDAA